MRFTIKDLFCLCLATAAFFAGYTANRIELSKSEQNKVSPISYQLDKVFLRADKFTYSPSTFRKDVDSFTREGNFATALALLFTAPVDELITIYGESYCVLDKSPIIELRPNVILPGTATPYVGKRDWIMPHTGDQLESDVWPEFCRLFATKYNRRVDLLFAKERKIGESGQR